jgi:NTE family protein
MSKYQFSRRRLLSLLATSIPSAGLLRTAHADASKGPIPATGRSTDKTGARVGIALGAGGANGLAHILMLEVLDEMGIRPRHITGSSIGAIIGALYASGMTGREIRELVEQFIISPDEPLIEQLSNKETLRWFEFIEVEFGNGGLLSSEGFIAYLYETLQYDTFEELKIPLTVVAADLWRREQIVLDSGELLPAVKASMALPGVFHPVKLDNSVLIDGGTVNPVPYDLLSEECDIVIGIDVSGERSTAETAIPGYFETLFSSVKVMQKTIMAEKLRRNQPDIYISPQIVDIRALEFYRAEQVFEQAKPAKQALRQQLARLLTAK